jgi:hypothetical protein
MKPVTKHFCNWLFKIQRFVGFFQKRGHILKRELLERYATQIHIHGRTDLVEKTLELGKQICEECEDSFIYLGVMGDMADI